MGMSEELKTGGGGCQSKKCRDCYDVSLLNNGKK